MRDGIEAMIGIATIQLMEQAVIVVNLIAWYNPIHFQRKNIIISKKQKDRLEIIRLVVFTKVRYC